MLNSIVNLKGRFLSGLLLFVSITLSANAHEVSLLVGEERWLYREYNSIKNELDREQGWLSSYETSAKLDVTNNSNIYLLDRKSTRLNSSHVRISYAVFC